MFVTFEGIEGAGKTAVIGMIAAWLEKNNLDYVRTREPGGGSLGKDIRKMLLSHRPTALTPTAELCLFLADRAQHLEEVVRPALEAGKIVLCDRYADSTIAYQGYARGMDRGMVEAMCAFAGGDIVPDHTILLDLPVPQGLARARSRNRASQKAGSESRFDDEDYEFHEKVRAGFLDLAREHSQRIHVINASAPPEECFEACLAALKWR